MDHVPGYICNALIDLGFIFYFQNDLSCVHDYNHNWILPGYTNFDDLDIISRSCGLSERKKSMLHIFSVWSD